VRIISYEASRIKNLKPYPLAVVPLPSSTTEAQVIKTAQLIITHLILKFQNACLQNLPTFTLAI